MKFTEAFNEAFYKTFHEAFHRNSAFCRGTFPEAFTRFKINSRKKSKPCSRAFALLAHSWLENERLHVLESGQQTSR